jgi:hypothetical protein
MPLMRKWVEIAVDEDLLVPVVRELLDMAVDANQVEVVHGTNGRVVLAESHLAEHWYQERLKRDQVARLPKDDFAVLTQTEVVTQVESSNSDATITTGAAMAVLSAAATVLPPAKQAVAPKPSASPNGEDK